jgi:ABC-type dipeptide/oligopeptide/nickel transport system ATPase component
MKKTPDIKPIKIKEYEVKQSDYDHVGKLPIRSLLIGPSGSGKTVLLQNMILDIYKDCFSRIYIFSPSIDIDDSWSSVKKYIEHDMKVKNTKDEPIFFDHYDPAALQKIINTQHKITEYMKKQGHKKLYQILIIVDDFADEPLFTRQSKLLHALFTRGRHSSISSIVSTQKWSALAPIIRVNATELYIYRLRNYKDIECYLDELSALYDKKTLLDVYNQATSQPYSFLYVKLTAPKKEDLFYQNLNKKIIVEEN